MKAIVAVCNAVLVAAIGWMFCQYDSAFLPTDFHPLFFCACAVLGAGVTLFYAKDENTDGD